MTHTSHPYRLIERLRRNADLSPSARVRLTWFLFAAVHQWNVSKTCRHFGIARSTFMRWVQRFDPRHPESLEEKSRSPHSVHSVEEDPVVVESIEQYRKEDPYINKEDLRERLQREHGITLSASTIGRIIQRHRFFFGSTPAHRAKRMESEDAVLDLFPIFAS